MDDLPRCGSSECCYSRLYRYSAAFPRVSEADEYYINITALIVLTC